MPPQAVFRQFQQQGIPEVRMWPFSRKPLVDVEMAEWMLDHAEWLLTVHARRAAFAKAQLIPISDKMFPRDGLDGHALAEHLFDRVLAFMGASDLPLRLVPDEVAGRYEATSTSLYAPQWRSMAAGTYSSLHGDITYDVNLLKRPVALVAVLSHEIAHAVVDEGAHEPPPSDPEFDELLTDFASVLSGFGLFQIAFRQPSNPRTPEGVEASARYYTYYMNRREACTATALFAMIHGIEPKLVVRAADMDARGGLKHAFGDLEAHRARIEEIRQAIGAGRAR